MNKYTIEIICEDDELSKDDIKKQIEVLADINIKKITKKVKARTDQQNKAIHQYFNLLAQACIDKHIDIHTLLSASIEHQVTPKIIKYQMWAKVQKTMYDTDSTAKLKSHEVTEIHATINNYTAETHGINIPFPSELNMR